MPIISITIEPDLLARIDKIATHMSKSRSAIANLLFADASDKHTGDTIKVGIIHEQRDGVRHHDRAGQRAGVCPCFI
jgi:predicted transcriptional regulator